VKQPSNEAYLAAELMAAAIPKHAPAPFRAAALASELCSLGRLYFRLSERLCGGEDEWGPMPRAQALIERTERRRERLSARMHAMAKESPFRLTLESDGGGLGLVAVTERHIKGGSRRHSERTALR
jgi:hypothetical protein